MNFLKEIICFKRNSLCSCHNTLNKQKKKKTTCIIYTIELFNNINGIKFKITVP